MSYRVNEHKPHRPHRDMHDVTTRGNIFVNNGIISHIAIPCFYYIIDPPAPAKHHDKQLHDYYGMPSNKQQDHICQPNDFARFATLHPDYPLDKLYPWWKPELDMDKLEPIHLTKEGYENIDTRISKHTISITGCIDPKDDWIVRLTIDSNDPLANSEKVVIPISVFATNETYNRKDLVYNGNVVILPNFVIEEN